MADDQVPSCDGLAARWLWLFPMTYTVHIAEEGLAGERFYRWIHRVVGRELSGRVFITLNLLYLSAMAAAVQRARMRRSEWIVPALGLITTANGFGHLVGSLATRSYSPGLVSGMTMWMPLGIVALQRSRRFLPRKAWLRGVMGGFVIAGGVAVIALPFTHRVGESPTG
jgi:Protein of unknown function with HXXEE motif